MGRNDESGGLWGCFIMALGIILFWPVMMIVVIYLKMPSHLLDGDVYKNDCYHVGDKEALIGILKNNNVDIDNLKPVELSEADSMTLTFQFKFPFFFSIPDNAEMLIYRPQTREHKMLLYAAPFPKSHKITFRVPKIREYPAYRLFEFWLISRSELTVCSWNQDEFLDFENESAPHNYRVKLLTRAYEYDNPYDHPFAPLRTTIFTPM